MIISSPKIKTTKQHLGSESQSHLKMLADSVSLGGAQLPSTMILLEAIRQVLPSVFVHLKDLEVSLIPQPRIED
jgi:hypothetical protein